MSRLLIATAALLAGAAAADEPKYVKLVQAGTDKVLAVADNSEEAGARVVAAKDDGGEAQQWRVVGDGDFLKLVNRKSGKVLDVFEASADEGAAVIVWEEKSDDNANQRWSWEGTGKGRRLKSKSSGHVLDLDPDGKAVQKKADDAAKGQLWEAVEVKK
jgi:hypothetical protein